jgi:hypothetical protein
MDDDRGAVRGRCCGEAGRPEEASRQSSGMPQRVTHRPAVSGGKGTTRTEPLPATAVVPVSPGTFEPSRFAEVDAVNTEVGVTCTPIVDYPVNWAI